MVQPPRTSDATVSVAQANRFVIMKATVFLYQSTAVGTSVEVDASM
jgi:hypothetical protein